MRFDLKTPCSNCPFRRDVTFYLRPGRMREILDGITFGGATFSCHKTTEWEEDDFGDSEPVDRGRTQHCAGAAILLTKIGLPNFAMRVATHTGMLDPAEFRLDAPVYDSIEEVLRAFPDEED